MAERIEQKTIRASLTPGGETRDVLVYRTHYDTHTTAWYSDEAIVNVRHRTGQKLYPVRLRFTDAEVEAGEVRRLIGRVVTVLNRHASVVSWSDEFTKYHTRREY